MTKSAVATETVWISVAAAARILEKTPAMVRVYIAEGRLRARWGPLGGRTEILTLADINRCCWALKAILQRKAKTNLPAHGRPTHAEESHA